jgi:Spy/CpxP family protein refolding chaperone
LAFYGVFVFMKTSILPLFFAGVALMVLSPRTTLADATTSAGSTTSGSSGTQGERGERWRAALAALDLTDAQKAQIKQIRSTVTDRKERFEQIKAVLTPEQKAKLREMIQERRNSGSATPAST